MQVIKLNKRREHDVLPDALSGSPQIKCSVCLGYFLLASTGLLSEAHAQTQSEGETRLDTVTSYSTSSPETRERQRTVTDSPTPIDIITSDQILKAGGRAELSEALSKLLPSFNFDSNYAGYNSVQRSLSNRSLGPAYTLVLVNGKRRHMSAIPARGGVNNSGANYVDIDMIPVSAVERIEVLRDGAAAQYGSDAVAGVINIILKSSSQGGHVGASYGMLYSREGETLKFEGDHGFELGDDGFLHLFFDARKRADADFNDKAAKDYRAFFDDAQNANWNRKAVRNGDPRIRAWNLGYNTEFALTNNTRVYSNATYGIRKSQVNNWMRLANGNASIPELFPGGYVPLNNLRDTDYQFLVGVKGQLSQWNWDFSNTYGRNKVQHSSHRTLNPTYGPESPTTFDHLATLKFDQAANNLDITRAFAGAFGKLQASVGAEHRWERFKTIAGNDKAYTIGPYKYPELLADGSPNPLYLAYGPQTAVGAQAVLVITPEDEVKLSRNVWSGYFDLGFDPTDKFYLGLAGRFEHYSDDTDSTFNVKLSSRYELTDTFSIRGSAGTGFRAPSLTQQGYTMADNRVAMDNDGNIVPARTRLVAPSARLAQAMGAKKLDSEDAVNYGLGFTWRPAPRTSVTLDAYLIYIKDRIILTENIYETGSGVVSNILESVGEDPTTWTNFYTNAFDTKTRGLDLVADHFTDFGAFGGVRWSAAFNWNKTTIEDSVDSPGVLAGSGINLIGRARKGELTDASPKTKWILGANWAIRDVVIDLRHTRYGKVKTIANNPSGDRSFSAKWITDLDVSYNATDNVVLSLGANNLFNVHPDKHAIYNSNGLSRYGYPPFHPGGGFWYAKVAYDY